MEDWNFDITNTIFSTKGEVRTVVRSQVTSTPSEVKGFTGTGLGDCTKHGTSRRPVTSNSLSSGPSYGSVEKTGAKVGGGHGPPPAV